MKRLMIASLFTLFATPALADHTTIYGADVTAFQTGKRIDSAKSGKLVMFVCEEHFPPGSSARAEIYKAVRAYNDVATTMVAGRPPPGRSAHTSSLR